MNKIAILGTRGIPARYGGFETFAEELATRLVKKGYEVTVFCELEEGPQPESYCGISLRYAASPSFGPLTTVYFDLLSLWMARKGFDIVYLLGYGAAPFCFIPRIWGSRVWLNVDGIEWARAKWGPMAKAYFKLMELFSMWSPNRVIADAEGIKTHLKSRHRRLPPCSVVPYGAPLIEVVPEVEMLNEWGIASKRYYLIVSRIEPENHVREIVEGYKSSQSPFPLVVVGNHKVGTPYADNLLRLADKKVKFIGGVYDKEKLQTLRYHSLAYLHGHSVGGTNPSLLEALGCGNLIIAHDNVFNREVAGDIGFYFKSEKDISGIIERIELLPETVVSDLADKAKARIIEKYNWDNIANIYIQLIKKDMQ